MPTVSKVWSSLFDIRKGEIARTLFMSLYLLCVMVAYYILKPVSAAMFLNKFNIDKLPYLYILVAVGGGMLAYLYTHVALKSSLQAAVSGAMAIAVLCLVALWWLIGLNLPWMLYVFNVWVSLFSIVLMSQGWLVAANVFTSREAKRLYGLLGLGAVVGAGLGSAITTLTVKLVGTRNLILACAVMVILAYVAFRLAAREKGLAGAKGAKAKEIEFSLRDISTAIGRYRHLQVIIGIILVTFIVDELVDFQFQAMAKRSYRGDQLTAFFGGFYAWLSAVSFVLQFFLTAWVVRRAGVGGTLKIMPASIAVLSLGTVVAPGLLSTVATRFVEAVNRYTFNRTGMELLYLPLPSELRNRTKAFVDIFVDRAGRGVAGILLALLLWAGIQDLRKVSAIAIGFAAVWLVLAQAAQREYMGTVRRRLEKRRLNLEEAHVPVNDAATLALLEQTTEGSNPRQVCYALSLLAEAADYDLSPVLRRLSRSPEPEVRGKVYEVAWFVRFEELYEAARAEIRTAGADSAAAVKPAVVYVLSFPDGAVEAAREFLEHPDPRVAEGTLEALQSQPAWLDELITPEWLGAALEAREPSRRCLAAFALSVRRNGSAHSASLRRLLEDGDAQVVNAACRAAGTLQDRGCVDPLVQRLADPAVRAAAIESLALYGTRIIGLLGDLLADPSVPVAVRRQIPRVLRMVPDQRSVDVLLGALGKPELSLRASELKALNHLRETAPDLNYGATFVTEQILQEARHYFELYAALEPLREQSQRHTATGLLQRSIEDRLRQTIERLFRLLGLRYPAEEMHSAYLAVQHRRQEQFQAALEFLDTVLERSLKRVLLPMLDSTERLTERGRDLFGVEVRDAEATLRELIRAGDPWLAACAMATAAEQQFHRLTPDITEAGRRSGAEVLEVAQAAVAGLA
ncbi:MAG: HEAT repeat domain-containing protein [Acidobacteria bacterium]|nr:HEAT repeat domain-containing protein [Acidobacteriota bacterium]MBI3472104.1 HEAT repeat domain-containing protein [Candidatus Solibacter usitatus]